MKLTRLLLIGGLLTAALSTAQTVTQVGNGASYDPKVAQGSIFVVIGTNLGPASIALAPGAPLQKTLANTSVKLTPVAGGTPVDAYMFYSLNIQVAALLPSTTPVGNYNLTVTFNGAPSANFPVTVVDRNFGIISRSGSGKGQAVVQNFAPSGTYTGINGYLTTNIAGYQFAPAHQGDVLVLWGTGLGPITASDSDVPGAQDLRGQATIKVLVAGREIAPAYAGRAPQFPGEDQINFTLPGDITTGCNIPVQVSVNGALSTEMSLAIAPTGGADCVNPILSKDVLTRLMNGGTATAGVFSLSKNAIKATVLGQTITSNSEAIAGNFSKYSVDAVGQLGGAAAAAAVNAVGTCAVFKQTLTGTSLVGVGGTVLDAGTITLNGPGVSNKTLNKTNNSYALSLTNPLQPGQTVISPGTYTLTGGGGADVAAFSAPLTMSTPVTWSNIDAITAVNRTQPLTFTWTGGGGTDIVSLTIFGGSSTTVNNVTTTDATIVTCLAAASAGTFTISTSYLSQLPAVSGDLTSGQFGAASVLSVTVPPNGTLTTNPGLTAGGNVDYFLFSGSSGGFKNLAIQ